MISYREKEMMMVMKCLADHSREFAEQIADATERMVAKEQMVSLSNKLPDISDYESLVEFSKNLGYDSIIRIGDLLSQEELDQLEKEYEEIENNFKEQTGLNKTDIIFVVIAVLLQMTRQVLQPSLNFDAFKSAEERDAHDKTANEAKKSSYDEESAKKTQEKAAKDEKEKLKKSRYYYASVKDIADIEHVPYDVVAGTKKYNVKLSGPNHRVKTLGHDPWLGYFFGTCNILTNTMSLGKDNAFRTLHIGKSEKGSPCATAEANLMKMVEYSTKRFKESKATVGLALIKQGYHIKSDEFSKEGLGLPFLQLFLDSQIIQELCESGIDYAKLDFLGTVGKQTLLSEMINYIISITHRITIVCTETRKESEKMTKDQLLACLKKNATLNEVRTRKIILISECIASAVNAIVIGGIEIAAALTENAGLAKEAAKKIDIGGYISTVLHLFSDIRFISKIKKDFIAKAIEEGYKEKLAAI